MCSGPPRVPGIPEAGVLRGESTVLGGMRADQTRAMRRAAGGGRRARARDLRELHFHPLAQRGTRTVQYTTLVHIPRFPSLPQFRNYG